MNITRFILCFLVITGIVLTFIFMGGKKEKEISADPKDSGFSSRLPVADQDTGNISDAGRVSKKQSISLATIDGESVTVPDFLNDPETIKDTVNPDYYRMGDVTPNSPYLISYISPTQYFDIVLLQEPIGESRRLVEQYLKQYLGISENDLCLIKYMIGVPSHVNTSYGGRSLGFSFCPGAVVLPN